MKLSDDLRQSVLQAAMEGKLTKQLKEDGNADDLLVLIEKEKAKLIKEKKIKKAKPLPKISEDVIPFDIPNNWMFIPLGKVANIARGGSPRPIKQYLTTDPDGINWIKIGDTDKNGKYISHVKEKIIPAGIKKSRFVHTGDFLLTNSMSYGRPYILKTNGCIHDGWLVISQPVKVFDEDFLYYLLSSNFVFKQFSNTASGAVVKNLNIEKVANTIIPLPPLAEQHRIVEKVEALMAEIDELEKKENELEKLKKEFPEDMKASLLQAAMEGKLTKQKLDYMPSKNRLYEEVNDISLKYLNSDLPNLPKNWSYVFLKDVAKQKGGFAFKSQNYSDNGIRVIRISDFDENGINNKKVVKYKMDSSLEKYLIHNNDILLCMTGGTVGKNCLARVKDDKLLLNQRVADITATEYINYKYLFYCINMPINQSIIQNGKNSTNDNISSRLINKFIIPLPPLEEQMRIVAKLDELLPLCEELKEDKIR